MAGERYRFFRAREDGGQLLAEQHEDDAVERELDRVPYRIAPHPGDRHRLPRYFGKGHRHAGAHRREDARGMEMLGEQIGAERDQQADEDLRAGILAPALRHPRLGARHRQRNRNADRQSGPRDP